MLRREKALISLGAAAIALMALSLVFAPSRGYELSIYSSTPLGFWGGLSLALLVGTVGGVASSRRTSRLVLAGVAVTAIVIFASLPYLRGYFFFGQNDPLQHLGWTRDIVLYATYGNDPYPGIHLLAAHLSFVTGMDISSTLLLVAPAGYLSFILALPLLAKHFSGGYSPRVISIGLLCGGFIPMIMAVLIPRMQPTPTVVAMHFTPLVLWMTLSSIDFSSHLSARFLSCLFIMQTGLLVLHPQFLLVLLVIDAVYLGSLALTRGISNRSWAVTHPSLISSVLLPGTLMTYWLVNTQLFGGATTSLITGLLYGQGASVANPWRSGLAQAGGSVLTLYTRALSTQLLVAAITVAAGLISLSRIRSGLRNGDSVYAQAVSPDGRQLRLSLGFIPVVGLGAVYLAAGDLSQAVRYLSFVVGLGCVIVAVRLLWTQELVTHRTFVLVACGTLVLGASLSVPATFGSPYLFKPNHQVTETQMSGYDWLFENAADDPILAVDTDVDRQYRALYGNERFREWLGSDVLRGTSSRGQYLVGPHFNDHRLSSRFENDPSPWYLVTSEFSRAQQTRLYEGFRFTVEDYGHLDRSASLSRVHDNGDTVIYRVRN